MYNWHFQMTGSSLNHVRGSETSTRVYFCETSQKIIFLSRNGISLKNDVSFRGVPYLSVSVYIHLLVNAKYLASVSGHKYRSYSN